MHSQVVPGDGAQAQQTVVAKVIVPELETRVDAFDTVLKAALGHSAWRVGLMDANLLSTSAWAQGWEKRLQDAQTLKLPRAQTEKQWKIAHQSCTSQVKRWEWPLSSVVPSS